MTPVQKTILHCELVRRWSNGFFARPNILMKWIAACRWHVLFLKAQAQRPERIVDAKHETIYRSHLALQSYMVTFSRPSRTSQNDLFCLHKSIILPVRLEPVKIRTAPSFQIRAIDPNALQARIWNRRGVAVNRTIYESNTESLIPMLPHAYEGKAFFML